MPSTTVDENGRSLIERKTQESPSGDQRSILKGADDADALDSDGRLGRRAGDAEPRAAGNRTRDGRLCDGSDLPELDRVYGQRTRGQLRTGLRAGRTLAALRAAPLYRRHQLPDAGDAADAGALTGRVPAAWRRRAAGRGGSNHGS